VYHYFDPPANAGLSEAQRHARDKRNEAFEVRLEHLKNRFADLNFNIRRWLSETWNAGDFDQILILDDPDSGCNFDGTMLRFANGNPLDADHTLPLLKLNLFVRLWRKLGWTIEETDRALQCFLPGDIETLDQDNIGAAMQTALIYLAHLKALDDRLSIGKKSRIKLLTLWVDLFSTGKNPLYQQLFLSPSMLKDDPDSVFDHPLGKYLCTFRAARGTFVPFRWNPDRPENLRKGNVGLKNHLLELQDALNLTADDIGHILCDAFAGPDEGVAQIVARLPLTMQAVSTLYRYALLAGALELSIEELIVLKDLSGLNPFTPLHARPLRNLSKDYPFTRTLAFVEVAAKVRQSGFSVENLNYLLWHRFDPLGKYRTNAAVPLSLVQNLAAEIGRIRDEHAVSEDPMGLTDEMLRQKLALLLPTEVAEEFMGMWTGNIEYEAVYKNDQGEVAEVAPEDRLNPDTYASEGAIRVAYDSVRRRQRLVYKGVLFKNEKDRLVDEYQSKMFKALLNDVQRQARRFFRKYLEKYTIGSQSLGFFKATDFNQLFQPIPDNLSDKKKQTRLLAKRTLLANALLPQLQQRLILQLVVQTLTKHLSAEPTILETLITNSALLKDPTSRSDETLCDAFVAAEKNGISAAFYSSSDGSGSALKTTIATTANTKAKPSRADTNSARFEGFLEVEADGPYRFFIVFENSGAEAELNFAHLPEPLIQGTAGESGAEIDHHIELTAGMAYGFSLEAHNLNNGDIKVLVQGENLPKGSLARLILYPASTVCRVHRAEILLTKTLQIIQGLGLDASEVIYLLTHPDDFDGLDLSSLPTFKDEISSANSTDLFRQLLRLVDYTRAKQELAGGGNDLIAIFETAGNMQPDSAETERLNELYQSVADLTRRDPATVEQTAVKLGLNAEDFAQEIGLQRLWEALQVVQKFGVPVEDLAGWATPVPDFKVAKKLRNMVKARYETGNWQRIVQPISDSLRQQRRDALVDYVVHNHPEGFRSLDQLFEYFLIDPGMEPVVQTSRLQTAIAAVRLFIQRCLLNLEPWVDPSVINSKQWRWMKRYRIWEVNRKFFIYPENWLEPEFRDEKSHLFQDLESTLLQGDVSQELVEGAYYQYLSKLDEIARLEIMTVYCEEKPEELNGDVLHVIGRTFNPPQQYFYRRYAYGMWTPWEPMEVQIEGDHLTVIMWQGRLHLFWVTFMEKAEQDTNTKRTFPTENGEPVTVEMKKEVQVQLNWSEYFKGQWTTRKSGGFEDAMCVGVSNDFEKGSVFIHATRDRQEDGTEGRGLRIHLVFNSARDSLRKIAEESFGHIDRMVEKGKFSRLPKAFRLVSKNSLPEEASGVTPHKPPYLAIDEATARYRGKGSLKQEEGTKAILGKGNKFLLTFAAQPEAATSGAGLKFSPFFYQDNRNENTFFVEKIPVLKSLEKAEETGVWVKPQNVIHDLKDAQWKEFVPFSPFFKDVKLADFLDPITPLSKYMLELPRDWCTDSATLLEFDGELVGADGVMAREGLMVDAAAGDVSAMARAAELKGFTVIGSKGLTADVLGKFRYR
jgi:hypothetical protein